MHPAICAFISEQVMTASSKASPHTDGQAIGGEGQLSGNGLRWLPVPHEGNCVSSSEEALALRSVYDSLIGRQWTDEEGVTADLTSDDILVVAPYTAQVHELAVHLPAQAPSRHGRQVPRPGSRGRTCRWQPQAPRKRHEGWSSSTADTDSTSRYPGPRRGASSQPAPRCWTSTATPSSKCASPNMLCRYVEMSDDIR